MKRTFFEKCCKIKKQLKKKTKNVDFKNFFCRILLSSESSTSSPGGNQVDGLPLVSSICGTGGRICVFEICLTVSLSKRVHLAIQNYHAKLALSSKSFGKASLQRKSRNTHLTIWKSHFWSVTKDYMISLTSNSNWCGNFASDRCYQTIIW